MPRARPQNPGGRPRKYTAPIACSIVADVGAGLSREEAAIRAGVGITTLERWIAAGNAGDPEFKPFLAALRQVESGRRGLALLGRIGARAIVSRLDRGTVSGG